MFEKLYKVKGIDVNGFMVMQNAAYVTYATKLVEVFLTENRFSKARLNKLQIGLQKNNEQVICKQHLMFNQTFTAVLSVEEEIRENNILRTTVSFYNNKQELCTRVQTEFYWFNYKDWKVTEPPKTITNLFTRHQVQYLKNAS